VRLYTTRKHPTTTKHHSKQQVKLKPKVETLKAVKEVTLTSNKNQNKFSNVFSTKCKVVDEFSNKVEEENGLLMSQVNIYIV
jgi:hypothetical protein